MPFIGDEKIKFLAVAWSVRGWFTHDVFSIQYGALKECKCRGKRRLKFVC